MECEEVYWYEVILVETGQVLATTNSRMQAMKLARSKANEVQAETEVKPKRETAIA